MAELAKLQLDKDVQNFLSDINDFNLEGRYIEHLVVVPELKQAKSIMRRVEETMTWLNAKL